MSEVAKDNQVPDRWIRDGHDYILHLGTMRKAVVVARYIPQGQNIFDTKNSWYAISPRSYFPFTDAQQEKRFKTGLEAIGYAEGIILEWLNSITTGFAGKKSPNKKLLTTNENLLD